MKSPRKQVREALDRYRANSLAGAVNAALFECADAFRAEAHRSISAGSISGKNHVPSKPGQPPMRDTGNLQAHIETSQPEPFVAQVTSSAAYAAPLEFGTSKMAARPYMRPARDKVLPVAERILERRLNRATKVY